MLVEIKHACVGAVDEGWREEIGGIQRTGERAETIGNRKQARRLTLPALGFGIDGGVVGGEVVEIAAQHRQLPAEAALDVFEKAVGVADADVGISIFLGPDGEDTGIEARDVVIHVFGIDQGIVGIGSQRRAGLHLLQVRRQVVARQVDQVAIAAARLSVPKGEPVMRSPAEENAMNAVWRLPPEQRGQFRGAVVIVAARAPALSPARDVLESGIRDGLRARPGEAGVIDDHERLQVESEAILGISRRAGYVMRASSS